MSILKKIRKKSGFTQAALAKQSGLSLRTIQRLESSNKEPKGHTLIMLSEVFNIDPNCLQDKFQVVEQIKKSEKTTIQLINLSIISFVIIPFSNIVFPFILWYRNRHSNLIDEAGRRIINFQIIWWIMLALLLSASPVISRIFLSGTQIILYVLLICYIFNVIIVYITATKLKQDDFNFLHFPIRFL